jgi:apolipoprotein N-acyltransferase
MTGIVFNAFLSDTRGAGAAAVGSDLAHIASPVLATIGWLLFGPRGALSWRLIPRALLFPLAWTAATLVRGALIDTYPYFFVDAGRLGYDAAMFNLAGLGAVFVAVAAAFVWLDRLPWRAAGERPLR